MIAEATQTSAEVMDAPSKSNSAIVEYTKTEAALADLRDRIKGVVFDVKTTAGDKAARAARKECVTLRTALEEKRLELNAKDQERIRRRNAEAKRITSEIEALEDPIDEQIKAEETRKENEKKARAEAERQRIAAIHERIEDIRQQALEAVGEDAATIHARIQALSGVEINDSFAEFEQQAEGAKATTLVRLRSAHAKATAHEEQQRRLAEERVELEEQARQQAAERARIAEQEAEAKAAREAQERLDREAREAEEQRVARETVLAHNRLEEIQGIQHQVMIASLGRGRRKGDTRECIVETLAETERWDVSAEKFGPMLEMAVRVKAAAIEQIKQLLVQWDERAEADRLEAERQERILVEDQRLADERAQLARDQEELQRVREAGDGGPVGPTASEGDDSNIATAATEPERESTASSTSGPEATSSQGNYAYIIFDGPPSATAGRFVEVEDAAGKSISIGEWIERPDGFWALRIERHELRLTPSAWMRRVTQPGGPWGPAEYHYELVAGDDQPEGDGWIALYRKAGAV